MNTTQPTTQPDQQDTFWGRCDPLAVTSGPFRFKAPEWREDNTCSHCGGLRPSLALEAIRNGAQVTPTDKNYKMYVIVPDEHHGKTRVVSSADHAPEGGNWQPVTEELKAAHPHLDWSCYGKREFVLLDTHKATTTAKCYFNHFSESQAIELIRLYEAKKINMAEPGCFYSGLCFGVYAQAIRKALRQEEA